MMLHVYDVSGLRVCAIVCACQLGLKVSLNDRQKFERQSADPDNLSDEGTVALNFS